MLMRDLTQFLVVFSFILLAFSVGLFLLFRELLLDGVESEQLEEFADFPTTLLTLFSVALGVTSNAVTETLIDPTNNT